MKRSIDYLDDVKIAKHLDTDYKLSKLLGTSTARISLLRSGARHMSNNECRLVAQILDIQAIELIALVEAESAKSDEERSAWANLYRTATQRLAASLAIVTLSLGLISTGQISQLETVEEGSKPTLSAIIIFLLLGMIAVLKTTARRPSHLRTC